MKKLISLLLASALLGLSSVYSETHVENYSKLYDKCTEALALSDPQIFLGDAFLPTEDDIREACHKAADPGGYYNYDATCKEEVAITEVDSEGNTHPIADPCLDADGNVVAYGYDQWNHYLSAYRQSLWNIANNYSKLIEYALSLVDPAISLNDRDKLAELSDQLVLDKKTGNEIHDLYAYQYNIESAHADFSKLYPGLQAQAMGKCLLYEAADIHETIQALDPEFYPEVYVTTQEPFHFLSRDEIQTLYKKATQEGSDADTTTLFLDDHQTHLFALFSRLRGARLEVLNHMSFQEEVPKEIEESFQNLNRLWDRSIARVSLNYFKEGIPFVDHMCIRQKLLVSFHKWFPDYVKSFFDLVETPSSDFLEQQEQLIEQYEKDLLAELEAELT